MNQNHNPEFRLLCELARPDIDPNQLGVIIDLIQAGINWERLIRLAESHKVLAVLSRGINCLPENLLPETIVKLSHDFVKTNLLNNLSATQKLLEIVRLFEQDSIQCIPYKGAVLTQMLYSNLALRQFGDLDIIVAKQDLDKAIALLIQNDFFQIWPKKSLTFLQERSHIENKYNFTYYRAADRLILELHWGVTPKYISFPPSPNWLWQRAVPKTVFGRELLSFSPEDYLLILCVHGGNHCWIRLNWICDLAELIYKYQDLEWSAVLQQAALLGVNRNLAIGLLLANHLLGAILPESVWQIIRTDKQALALAAEIESYLLQLKYIGSKSFAIPLFHLRSREKLKDKLRYLYSMTSPSDEDWTFVALPDILHPLYYIIRPLRLLVEYGIKSDPSKLIFSETVDNS